jgi:xanthine dehydrogenase YagR molybdenum-binding subunit
MIGASRFGFACARPRPDTHLGSGGMLGTCDTAAAIANALFHATGRRIRDLPIRLEQLL